MKVKLIKTDNLYLNPIRINNLDFTAEGNEVELTVAELSEIENKRAVKKTNDFSFSGKYYKDITAIEIIKKDDKSDELATAELENESDESTEDDNEKVSKATEELELKEVQKEILEQDEKDFNL